MRGAGIILAAGRGSRMKGLTENKPKCALELAGKPLLRWQLESLKKAGIEDILVVRGYAAELLQGDFKTVDNPAWASANMLSSLLCADEFARKAFECGVEKIIVSYSDIVYHPDHALKLLERDERIAITYDLLWDKLWKLRFGERALLDAETFRQLDGRLQEIGGKTAVFSDIQGQYMGLLAFDKAGWEILANACRELGESVPKTDMTAFLRYLLAKGVTVGAVPVSGKWCEADNPEDLQKYELALQKGNWAHDWRT